MANHWTIAGLIGLTIGIVGYLIFPYTLKYGLRSQTNLAKNGMIFPLWSKPPFLTNSSMYLFEVENPKQAMKGAKIRVKRKGPYEFGVANNKERADFSDNEERVTFYSVRKFFYRPEISADIDERFYMLNPIVPSTQAMVKQIVMDRLPFKRLATPFVYQTVTVVLDQHNERLFQKKTPREILYGYKVRILENVFELADRFGLKSLLPEAPPENKLGIAFFQNETEDLFTLYTGVGKSVDRMADVITWRGQDKMSVWKSKKCNKIEGDNAELHRPMPPIDQPIKVFLAPACRSMTLDPVNRTTTISGIGVAEFELSRKMFQGIRTNPDNVCYCPDKTAIDCLYDGFAPMGPCLFNAPIFVSKTSFLDVDPRLKGLVEFDAGDSPAGLDKMAIFIEPLTGASLRLDLSLMASIKVSRQPYMRDMEDIRNLSYVPFFLTHEYVQIPENFAWQLKALLMFVDNYGFFFLFYGLTGGALATYGMTKKRSEKPVADKNKIDEPLKDSTATSNDKSMTKDPNEKSATSGANGDNLNTASETTGGNNDINTDTKTSSIDGSDSAIDVASRKESSVVRSSIQSVEVDTNGLNRDDTAASSAGESVVDMANFQPK